MADVLMAEPSSSTQPAQTRREHLLQTFEAYRAELDADVSDALLDSGNATSIAPASITFRLESLTHDRTSGANA
jgi:hypothetical protein